MTRRLVCRVVKTQLEEEKVVGAKAGEDAHATETVVSIVEEEEVVLFWNHDKNSRKIHELALNASRGQKDDKDTLDYYKSVRLHFI